MVYNNILEAIGGTPLIKLNRITDSQSADIYVKYEGLNVGGSVKTRTAYNMILQAEKDGLINKDTIIVEPTSGNQGIGLALVAAVRGYRAKIIMPDSVSEERRKLVRHYGAEVLLVHENGMVFQIHVLRRREENGSGSGGFAFGQIGPFVARIFFKILIRPELHGIDEN